MMKVKVFAIGKNEQGFTADAIAEYTKRLSGQIDFELIFLKETSVHDDSERVKLDEGDRLLQSIPGDYYKVVLDENGRQFTSQEFAQKFEQIRDFEGGKLAFLIGGPLGVSDDVREAADLILSLSKMTFTHQMVRIFLLEQVYRALQILQGTGYHKD